MFGLAHSVDLTKRVLDVSEAFGLGLDEKEFVVYDNLKLQTKQGDCIYITGQSGSGKSVLLRELARQYRHDYKLNVGILDEVELEDKPLIDPDWLHPLRKRASFCRKLALTMPTCSFVSRQSCQTDKSTASRSPS